MEACWNSNPICTSVIIVFWQRYICKLVKCGLMSADVVDLIMKFMPLKARFSPSHSFGCVLFHQHDTVQKTPWPHAFRHRSQQRLKPSKVCFDRRTGRQAPRDSVAELSGTSLVRGQNLLCSFSSTFSHVFLTKLVILQHDMEARRVACHVFTKNTFRTSFLEVSPRITEH